MFVEGLGARVDATRSEFAWLVPRCSPGGRGSGLTTFFVVDVNDRSLTNAHTSGCESMKSVRSRDSPDLAPLLIVDVNEGSSLDCICDCHCMSPFSLYAFFCVISQLC